MSSRRRGNSRAVNTPQLKHYVTSLIEKTVQSEKKQLFKTIDAACSTTGDLYNVSTLGQGDDVANRTGFRICGRLFELNFDYTIHASSTNDVVRTVVVSDKMNHDADPAVTDVLEQAHFTSQYSSEYTVSKRFRIHYDRSVTLAMNGNNFTQTRSIKLNLGKLPIFYNSNATGALGRNHLYVLIISKTGTNTANVYANTKLTYTDS